MKNFKHTGRYYLKKIQKGHLTTHQVADILNTTIDIVNSAYDIVNIDLHFLLKNVRPMLPPAKKHNTVVA